MSFSFMHIEKVKSLGTITSMYNHNCRKVEVSNAIPELADKNEDLIPLPVVDGKEMDYAEAYRRRIQSLPYYKDHVVRKGQVLGLEVVLTYTKDESVDVEKWKEKSIQWLKDSFNKAGDGQNNIMHAVFHGDETGNVHIHAFVVPIDEKGHLNCRAFTGGRKKMVDLQSSYAKSVESLGLQRGIAGSSAHHRDIRKMYAQLNNAINNIPKPLKHETAEQYRERVIEEIQTANASSYRSTVDFFDQKRRDFDEYTMEVKANSAAEVKQRKREIQELKDERDLLTVDLSTYRQQIEALANQMYEIEIEREKASEYDKIQDGIEMIAMTDSERANEIQSAINDAIEASDLLKFDIEMNEESL